DVAELRSAPRMLSWRLAERDDITIAGPVLRHSIALSENDLVEIARTKGQSHLRALASRQHVSERLSDILIDRGNSIVLTAVADNSGARCSARGYKTLLDQAERDASLASALDGRCEPSPEIASQAGSSGERRGAAAASRARKPVSSAGAKQ